MTEQKVTRYVLPFGTAAFRGVGEHGPFTRFAALVPVMAAVREFAFVRFVVRAELLDRVLLQWTIDEVDQLAMAVRFRDLNGALVWAVSLDLSPIRGGSQMSIEIAGRVPGALLPGFAVILEPRGER